MNKKQGAVLIAAVIVALGLFVAIHSYLTLDFMDDAVPGPAFMPVICSTFMVFLGSIILVDEMKKLKSSEAEKEPKIDWVKMKEPIGIILVTFVAVVLFGVLGAIPTMFIYILVLLKVFGKQTWKTTAIVSVVFTIAVWFIFDRFLQIPLPTFMGM